MITVMFGQNPPCLILHAPNREPYICRDQHDALQLILDLAEAYVKAFPQPLDPKYRKAAEVFDGA